MSRKSPERTKHAVAVNKGEEFAGGLAPLTAQSRAEVIKRSAAGRKSIVLAFIGRSGSGKTTKEIDLVKMLLAAGRRVLIIDPDGGEAAWDKFKRYQDIAKVPKDFKGAVVVPFSDEPYLGTPTFAHIEKMSSTTHNGGNLGPWANTVIIIDDCNAVVPEGRVEKPLKWLFARRRQYGFDIIVTGHSWMRIPPFMFGYINAFLIGPTLEPPSPRKSFFSPEGFKRTEEARQYVNRYKEQYPDRYDGFLLLTIEGTPFKGVI